MTGITSAGMSWDKTADTYGRVAEVDAVYAPGSPLTLDADSDLIILGAYAHAMPSVLSGRKLILTHPELEVWLNADQLRGSRTPLITLMGAL